MEKKLKKIIFFGTDSYSLYSLQALIEAGFNVVAVITKPDKPSGRGQKLLPPAVKTYAVKKGIKVLQPEKIIDIYDDIKLIGTDIVGILSSYGKIIPKVILDLFNPGIINIHPSLLPKYRGASPIESVIANGEKETGISIMLLSPGMDDGPIYYQEHYQLSGHETSTELYDNLGKIGAQVLALQLNAILSNNLKAVQQNDKVATFCSMISKESAWLKPEIMSAQKCERLVRAYQLYPKTKYTINKHQIIIKESHVSEQPTNQIDILCMDKNYLVIDKLVAPSGKNMNAAEFYNGYIKQVKAIDPK